MPVSRHGQNFYQRMCLQEQIGLSQSPYIYAQGQAGVYAKDDIVYVEAGGGENAAAAFVPPRAQYYPVDRPVPVKTKMRKSKRFWLILFLVLLIVVIIIAVGIGVGIHVADKSSDEGY